MPEQELLITPDQLARRLDVAIALHACSEGAIQTVRVLEPRRLGSEAILEARRAIRVREAASSLGQAGVLQTMNRL